MLKYSRGIVTSSGKRQQPARVDGALWHSLRLDVQADKLRCVTNGKKKIQGRYAPPFQLITGYPSCRPHEKWPWRHGREVVVKPKIYNIFILIAIFKFLLLNNVIINTS